MFIGGSFYGIYLAFLFKVAVDESELHTARRVLHVWCSRPEEVDSKRRNI